MLCYLRVNVLAAITGTVGYDMQTAADALYHLIVDHQITSVANDRSLNPLLSSAIVRFQEGASPRITMHDSSRLRVGVPPDGGFA